MKSVSYHIRMCKCSPPYFRAQWLPLCTCLHFDTDPTDIRHSPHIGCLDLLIKIWEFMLAIKTNSIAKMGLFKIRNKYIFRKITLKSIRLQREVHFSLHKAITLFVYFNRCALTLRLYLI